MNIKLTELKMQRYKMNIILISLIILFSCSKEISPLLYDVDQCEHCRMILTDRKYGAEIITKKGKAFKFDATECMLKYLKEKKTDERDVDKYFVIDLSEPGKLTDATSATFLISPKMRSPMGENISAFADKNTAEKYLKENGGDILSWEDLRNKYK